VDITHAWDTLASESSLPSETKALAAFNERFKSDCAKRFALHAEMQLFTHYETGAALFPTMNYFESSKKACLLCESFSSGFGPTGRHQRGAWSLLSGSGNSAPQDSRDRGCAGQTGRNACFSGEESLG
jgi:hypothetical protein